MRRWNPTTSPAATNRSPPRPRPEPGSLLTEPVANIDLAPSRRELLLLGGITALAAIVRFATLDLQSFDHDEAVTAGRVILPNLGDTLSLVGSSERSPPLYYLVAWGWATLFGTGEVGLRSLSALAGTLTVPAAFLAGRELAARAGSAVRIGLIAAALVALNPHLVWYSQEARAYAFLVLFGALALAFCARATRAPSPANLALWAAASAAALLSHYFAALFIGAQATWLVVALGRERRRALLAAGAVVLVGLALLPLARTQEGYDRRNGFTETPVAERSAETGVDYFAGEEPDPLAGNAQVDVVQILAAMGGGALVLLSIWLVARRGSAEERRGAALAGTVAAACVALPLLLAVTGVDFANPRNLIAGLVPIVCLAALGFGGAGGRRIGPAAAAMALLLFSAVLVAINLSDQMQRGNWRGAAEAMGAAPRPRLIVTNANGDDPLAYYLGAEKLEGRADEDGARVDEILALATNYRVTAPRGFTLSSMRGMAPLFFLYRFNSDRPRRVRPSEVEGGQVLSERSAVLLDSP